MVRCVARGAIVDGLAVAWSACDCRLSDLCRSPLLLCQHCCFCATLRHTAQLLLRHT